MKRLLKRLPFLIVLGAGLWLWKFSGFPSTREIIWELPAGIHAVDIQISDKSGALLKREQFFFRDPPTSVSEHVRLSPGEYPARIFIRRADSEPEQVVSTSVHVGDEETLLVTLRK